MHNLQALACLACAAATASALVPAVQGEQQHVFGAGSGGGLATAKFQCDLPPVASPDADGLPQANDLFGTEEALLKQVERHAALVKVPTVCFDDLGGFDEDPRWAPYYDFHDVLVKTFPAVHERAKREIINRFGLLYTIEGSDSSLAPLLLLAHFDVVPVADPSTWTHPPFDAYFDGTWLWGRGSSDDKNSLTGLMSAAETLLSNSSWTPRRTVLLAFGFDEECSGLKGAGTITSVLESRYGRDSMALVLDEGGSGLQQVGSDALYALPAVSEKGHLDNYFELHVQGGHSSIPFPHTGIGIIAEIISALESHPYEPKLIEDGPVHNHLVCQARYSPDAEPEITKLVEKGDLESLAAQLVTVNRETQFRIQTSQSVDMIAGGQKINAMPEVIKLGVNYRIATHNSVAEVQKNTIKYIKPIVEKYGLTVKAFQGEEVEQEVADMLGERAYYVAELDSGVRPLYKIDYNGTLVITSVAAHAAAPISPVSGVVWDLFSGTIQHSFRFEGGRVVPVGELMNGNTDTRHYLQLTRNVYRWAPTRDGGRANMHTIDERINIHAHLDGVKFYYDLIRNFDASDV